MREGERRGTGREPGSKEDGRQEGRGAGEWREGEGVLCSAVRRRGSAEQGEGRGSAVPSSLFIVVGAQCVLVVIVVHCCCV